MPNGIETTYPPFMAGELIVYPAPPPIWMTNVEGYNAWRSHDYIPGVTPITFSEAHTIQQMDYIAGWLKIDQGMDPTEPHFVAALVAATNKMANLKNEGEYWSAVDPNHAITASGLTGPQLLNNLARTNIHFTNTDPHGDGIWTESTPGNVTVGWTIMFNPYSQQAVDYRTRYGNELEGDDYVISHELGHSNPVSDEFNRFHQTDPDWHAKSEQLADVLGDELSTQFPTDRGLTTITGLHPGYVLKGTIVNDILMGNTAKGFVFGEGGIDTVSYINATGGISADLNWKGYYSTVENVYTGIANITGSAFADTIIGDSGNNTLSGGAGNDSIKGMSGNDSLMGNQGFDTIEGNAGDDTIYGGQDGDFIRGGQGNDLVVGDLSNDVMYGDLGNDTMTGGGGIDTVYTQLGSGQDVWTDFHRSEGDAVRVVGGGYSTFQQGADTIVQLGDGTRLMLSNVQLSSLDSGWIAAA